MTAPRIEGGNLAFTGEGHSPVLSRYSMLVSRQNLPTAVGLERLGLRLNHGQCNHINDPSYRGNWC